MTVLITPAVLEPQADGPPTLRTLEVVELSRVPAAFEGIELGGVLYRITSVRHVVGSTCAAEVVLEALPVLATDRPIGLSGGAPQLELVP